jgi:hypothetical protein
VQPTFVLDELVVKDPLSGYSHKFFGGNYPILYKFRLPMKNDTKAAKAVRFYLASNDKFKVDTIAGAWVGGKMLWRRVPMIGNNEHWRILSATIPPGQDETLDFIVVPLGSRWGGLVGSLEIAPGNLE